MTCIVNTQGNQAEQARNPVKAEGRSHLCVPREDQTGRRENGLSPTSSGETLRDHYHVGIFCAVDEVLRGARECSLVQVSPGLLCEREGPAATVRRILLVTHVEREGDAVKHREALESRLDRRGGPEDYALLSFSKAERQKCSLPALLVFCQFDDNVTVDEVWRLVGKRGVLFCESQQRRLCEFVENMKDVLYLRDYMATKHGAKDSRLVDCVLRNCSQVASDDDDHSPAVSR